MYKHAPKDPIVRNDSAPHFVCVRTTHQHCAAVAAAWSRHGNWATSWWEPRACRYASPWRRSRHSAPSVQHASSDSTPWRHCWCCRSCPRLSTSYRFWLNHKITTFSSFHLHENSSKTAELKLSLTFITRNNCTKELCASKDIEFTWQYQQYLEKECNFTSMYANICTVV